MKRRETTVRRGKTYNTLQRLKAADSGVYCAPLRLLAWEVADVLNNKEGVVHFKRKLDDLDDDYDEHDDQTPQGFASQCARVRSSSGSVDEQFSS